MNDKKKKQLSDLFVVYQPSLEKKEEEKEVNVSTPTYNWNDFLRNIERAQTATKPTYENDDFEEEKSDEQSDFDWNSIIPQEYSQLWGFSSNQSTLYPVSRGVKNPFDNIIVSKARNTDAYYDFKTKFDEYKQTHSNSGLTNKDWDILEAIAGIESSYHNIQNQGGSSAWGYFQIMPDTANGYQQGAYETMKTNPELQMDLAVKNYKYCQNLLRRNSQYLEKSNLTPLQVMYGMWWNPSIMLKYLQTGKLDSFSDSDKNDLKSILKKAS